MCGTDLHDQEQVKETSTLSNKQTKKQRKRATNPSAQFTNYRRGSLNHLETWILRCGYFYAWIECHHELKQEQLLENTGRREPARGTACRSYHRNGGGPQLSVPSLSPQPALNPGTVDLRKV